MEYFDQIHPDEGLKKLLDLDVNLKTEKITLKEGLNRVIAEDLFAILNVPSFDKSPYDGYALRGEETIGASKENPIEFEVIEEIPAGHNPTKKLGKFQAAKILTGGCLPEGANVCVKYEYTEFTQDSVKISKELKKNTDIIRTGEDVKKGDLLVEKGKVLSPGILGLLSSQGIQEIEVYARPKVGIFATGTELSYSGENLERGQIFESNLIVFSSIFKKLGFEVVDFGILKDDENLIVEKTKEALEEVDLLVTTGGASVGDYDYALSSINKLGGKNLFWKTAMKPGGSIVVSRLFNKTIIGLSGNPGAAILGLYRVCYLYLKKLLGRRDLEFSTIPLALKYPVNKKSPRLRLLRGTIEFDNKGQGYFVEMKDQGNGVLSSFINCSLLGEVPSGSKELEAGQIINCHRVQSLFESVGE